jgi:transcriptional regulator with XRE-family HTH domain
MALLREADVLRALGRRVAELRVAQGRTQQQLADAADVSVQYLQRVEAGRENLTARSLVRLANLLRASMPDLFAKPTMPDAKPGRPRRAATSGEMAPKEGGTKPRRGRTV